MNRNKNKKNILIAEKNLNEINIELNNIKFYYENILLSIRSTNPEYEEELECLKRYREIIENVTEVRDDLKDNIDILKKKNNK